MRYTNEVFSKPIPEFEKYHITSEGDVINTQTGRVLAFSRTKDGEPIVDLSQDNRRTCRSVKVMVAQAFVPAEHDPRVFNTPIQLDGNRENLRADNIVWRPRWFAWRYVRQFNDPLPSWYYIGPIYDETTNMQYRSILEAAITTGSLCQDIHESLLTESRVFPGGEKYVYM